MSGTRLARSVCVLVAVAAVGRFQTFVAFAQPADDQPLGPARVTGDNVYVRSGASPNHYPIVKLQAADRVTVVSVVADWYEILPPKGAFSWISEKYVDTVDHVSGVVNGDNVRVRAGSSIPDYARSRYAVQMLLSRGAEVTILGQSPDGFLRIKPPSGATAWISRRFIEPATEDAVAAAAPNAEMPDSADKPVNDRAIEPAGDQASEPIATALTAVQSTRERMELQDIDEATRAVLARAILDRDFGSVLARYAAVAKQNDDDFARRYAQARMEQVNDMRSLVEATRRLHDMGVQSDTQRREYFQARAAIDVIVPPKPTGLDAIGELRLSALYPADSLPRRYRLVDPSSSHARTVGYVEVIAGSGLDGQAYLGQRVGIRAARKWLLAGSVEPMPVYLATEIIPLSQDAEIGESETNE